MFSALIVTFPIETPKSTVLVIFSDTLEVFVMQWEAIWRTVIKERFSQDKFRVLGQVEVGKLPLRVDLLIQVFTPSADYVGELQTLIRMFKSDNLFELKSPSDRLSAKDFFRLQGCGMLWLNEKASDLTALDDLALFYVITREVPKLFQELQKRGLIEKLSPGVYHLLTTISGYIYVVDQLPVSPEWYLLLLFSIGKQRREFLQRILRKKEKFYIEWSYYLYTEEVSAVAKEEGITILQEIDPRKPLDMLIKEMGLQWVIDEVGFQRLIKDLSINQKKEFLKLLKDDLSQNSG